MEGTPLWMPIVIGISIIVVIISILISNNSDAQDRIKGAAKRAEKKKNNEEVEFDQSELVKMRETAEDFLEFDSINKGMICFNKDPNYFTMAFGVHGINISMYSGNERASLKSGFMNILNTLKEDVQFLVQSRYVDLNKNFEFYKPIIDTNDRERERLLDRVKTEKSEPLKIKAMETADKLKQRNIYANHIIDFFKFYTKESECSYIKIFVVLNHRHNPKSRFEKREKVIEEAYDVLSNKVKIFREQFESLKLKTYELNSIQTANIMYNSILKNESSFMTLEEAIKNGLTDLVVDTQTKEKDEKKKYDRYVDDYDYDYHDEVAITGEDEE